MKAKFVNEALSDVLKPKSEEYIDKVVGEEIKNNFKNVSAIKIIRIILNDEYLFKKYSPILKKLDIDIKKLIQNDISNLKFETPEYREKVAYILNKENSILDRSPEELSKDKEKALTLLKKAGFNDETGPIQKKKGTIQVTYPFDRSMEEKREYKSIMKFRKENYKNIKFVPEPFDEWRTNNHNINRIEVPSYVIYPNGAIRRSLGRYIGKMKEEDPYTTYEDNALFLIDYINKKKERYLK